MNKNFRLAGQRNFTLGRITNFHGQLKLILKNDNNILTPQEIARLSLCIGFLKDLETDSKQEWVKIKRKLKFKNVEHENI
jgi:hypothetical protein